MTPSVAGQLDRVIAGFRVQSPIVDIITFATDPRFLGRKLYPVQERILREFFDQDKSYEELLIIAGRRSSKTFLTSIIASYLAYLWMECPDPYYLFEGLVDRNKEVCILCIATKEDQATILLDEIKAKLTTSPYFKDKIRAVNSLEIVLDKKLSITAATSNSASEVGKTAIAVLFDEIGKYGREKGTRDGEEVYDSLTPSVAQFAGTRRKVLARAAGDPSLERIIRYLGKIISISTPMGKQGILWRLYNTALRLPSMLMYQLPTWEMNPNYPRDSEYLRTQEAKNPRLYRREFGAMFEEAVDGMFPPELVDARAADTIRTYDRIYSYIGALDTSRKRDGFAFAVAHLDDQGRVIVDRLRYWLPPAGKKIDWPPVIADIDGLCRQYRVEAIFHDQYEAEAVALYLKKYALTETTFTQSYKMEIYTVLENLMHQAGIEYPADERLLMELKALQREYNGDRFSVHHPDSGDVTTDDGPDVLANLAYHLFKQHAAEKDSDDDDDSVDSSYNKRDLRDELLITGGGYH